MAGATLVLMTLASAQFLMTLDTSVMNVAIATVAKDVNTTVSGVQSAITLYALVMAALMITGGKIGGIIGRKKAFSIGCVIYGAGSMTTALAKSLTVLIFGWSLLEGIGAALILPAVVALVASNFPAEARPKAYGLVMSAGAIAVAVGPLIGGLFTTYLSWRLVFAGEVLIVLVDPRARAQDRRRARPEAPQARRRRRRAFGLGSRDRRFRCPQVGHVGLDHPALRGARSLGDLADDVADLRRRLRGVALPPLGAEAHIGGQGDPREALDVQGASS